MTFPAHVYLGLARVHIEAAREARDAKSHITKHYQAANSALTNIDDVKVETATLRDMIAAFQDLATVLDNSGVTKLQKEVSKCQKKADGLR